MSGSIPARAVVGLVMLVAVGCAGSGTAASSPRVAGCHALRAGQPAPGPVPRKVARRLPTGVFYVLAGPNPDSTNLWQITNSGCERQLTHNRRGFGVSDFGASQNCWYGPPETMPSEYGSPHNLAMSCESVHYQGRCSSPR